MSEEKIPLGDIYDLSKNITGAEINTGFILGLERIIIYFITEVITDKTTIQPMFEKFDQLLTGKAKPADLSLSETEANVYTVFALQQLLRSLAFEQDLVKKTKVEITKEEAKSLFKAYVDKDAGKIKEYISKIEDQTNEDSFH
jgi:hypothetical protein